MCKYKEITAYRAAEIIQGRFRFNDDGDVIECSNRYMSDVLGSDWAFGKGFDDSTPVNVFYRAVREKAERKYGELPF
jgi:hypothetical protein